MRMRAIDKVLLHHAEANTYRDRAREAGERGDVADELKELAAAMVSEAHAIRVAAHVGVPEAATLIELLDGAVDLAMRARDIALRDDDGEPAPPVGGAPAKLRNLVDAAFPVCSTVTPFSVSGPGTVPA